MQKRLKKSICDRKICGVCGGVAEYINLDPTVVRLLWVILGLTSIGVIAYIVAAIVMPDA